MNSIGSSGSGSSEQNTIAVPIDTISVRGPASPWEMLRDAVALRLHIDANELSIESIGLGPADYARLMAEERLHRMRGFEPSPDRASFIKGVIEGFAYVGGSR